MTDQNQNGTMEEETLSMEGEVLEGEIMEDAAPEEGSPGLDSYLSDGGEGCEARDHAELEGRLKETEAALEASRQETLRALADMQNLRKRTAREVQQARDFALETFARDLLSVSDNMERALASIPPSEDVALKALIQGVGMVQAEMNRIFERHGITRVVSMGAAFDPNLHQAVQQMEAPGAAPGSVVLEMQPGFLLNGRLLRAAMVGIAKEEV